MKLNRKNTLIAAALSLTLAAPCAFATPYYWAGATNGTWNTGANWSGITVPLIADDLTILGPLNIAGALTIDFDADNSANSLIFSNTAATFITNTTSGVDKTLTLGSGGITTGAGAVQIGANVANQAVNISLGAAQTWNIGAGGMTVTNLIGGLGTGLTKTGAGNLTLNSGIANTFTGGLNTNGGTLTLDYNNLATPTNLVAATNALQINNGALTITGKNAAAATTAQTFASTSLGAGVNTVNIAKGASATSATLNLGTLTVNSGSGTIFSPTTAWTTTASTTERVFISAGGSVPTLPAGANTAFVNAGVFHRAAGGAAGSLRLAAVNSSGQLLLKANAGNLAAATGVDPTNSYQLTGASNIQLTNAAASVYGLLLNATSNGVSIIVANSGTLTLNSIIQIKATEGVNINAGTGTSNIIIGSEKNLVIAMDNTAAISIGAPIANNGSTGGVGGTASALTIVGSNPSGNPGTVTLGGANTYSGATTITRGTLSLNNVDALQNTSGLTLGGTSAATLTTVINGITLAAPITIANSGVSSTIAFGRSTAAAGSITLNGAIGGGGNIIFSTPNNNSGGNAQTINLGAAGTYAGSTTMTTGNFNNSTTIRNTSGAANVLPVTTVLTMSGGSGTGSGRTVTFDLNGQNQELAGLTNVTAADRNQRITSSTAATLTINNSADYTFGNNTTGADPGSGQLTGAVALTKKGAGTFTLASGIGHTHTGKTVVEAGILSVEHQNSLQNSAFDTTNSMTGTSTGGLRATVTTLNIGGLIGNKNFADVFTTTGGYTGLTALTLNPGSGITHIYSGDIGDGATSMTVTKTGGGTQILSGDQTYTGATNINAGTLVISATGSTDASSVVTVGTSGTLAGSGTINGGATINGFLAPGETLGVITFGSTLALASSSTTIIEIDGIDRGTDYDGVDTSGALTYGGALTLELGFIFGNGSYTFDLFDILGGQSGDLTSVALTGSYTGTLTNMGSGIWQTTTNSGDQTWSFSQSSGNLTLNVIPEPSTALLGGLGILALLRRRRR